MIKEIRVNRKGGKEVMKYEKVEIGEKGKGEESVRNEEVGMKLIEVYLRKGIYKEEKMKLKKGNEGEGIVVEVGEGVEKVRVGESVEYDEKKG